MICTGGGEIRDDIIITMSSEEVPVVALANADAAEVNGKPKRKKVERRPNALAVARRIHKIQHDRPRALQRLRECKERQASYPKKMADLKRRQAELKKSITDSVKEKMAILEAQAGDPEFRVASDVSVLRNAITRCNQGKEKNDEKIERLEAELNRLDKAAKDLEKKRLNCADAMLSVEDLLEAIDRKANHDSDDEMED